jgi:hypothetical protein
MSHCLQLELENGISLRSAGYREAVEQLPIVLLSNHHQENEEPFEMSAFHVGRSA